MKVAELTIAVLLLTVAPTMLGAQDSTAVRRDETLIGFSVGFPGHSYVPEPELFTIGFHVTRVPSNSVGSELAVGTMPRVLLEGVFGVGARGGLAVPFSLSEDNLLVASGGLSGIAATEGGGDLLLGGVYGGVAGLFLKSKVATRLGITWHWFQDGEGAIWLIELGVLRRRSK